ncbi:hypothetical protein T484DRAFT_1777018 [Baffinella frigidus]|nr:hypothetical protein T484DRAFT_1777018 [Cryptophyta sp. CCMP2293]
MGGGRIGTRSDLWRRKEISLTQRLEAERADRDALQQRLDEYRTRKSRSNRRSFA